MAKKAILSMKSTRDKKKKAVKTTMRKEQNCVVAYGMKIKKPVYQKVMKIGKDNSRTLPYMINIALAEFAEKYENQKV